MKEVELGSTVDFVISKNNGGHVLDLFQIVDDTIATIYVDGVALNARAYKRPGESLSLFASEGSLKVTNCKVTTGLKK